ncbi:hypothetical protein B7486_74905, partial [cyanobacterium TDX16]
MAGPRYRRVPGRSPGVHVVCTSRRDAGLMRRRVPLLIVLLALLVVASCGGASDAGGPGDTPDGSAPARAGGGIAGGETGRTVEAEHELVVDGLDRRYLAYAPASLPAEHVPVVVFLHGGLG